jgi:predicted site-specific integrase-resolvase
MKDLHPKKPEKSLKSLIPHCEDGAMKERFHLPNMENWDTGDITLLNSLEKEKKKEELKSVIVGSPVTIKGDLGRQIQLMREKFPDHTIIKDYGSGLNFKRKGLKTILDHSFDGNLKEVVVTHKDRLCRFGYDLL